MTRQRRYQLKRRTLGRCIICAQPSEGERCPRHHADAAGARRRRLQQQPWQPGRPGRPPISATLSTHTAI